MHKNKELEPKSSSLSLLLCITIILPLLLFMSPFVIMRDIALAFNPTPPPAPTTNQLPAPTTNQLTAAITVGKDPTSITVGKDPTSIAVNPVTNIAYVTNKIDNTVTGTISVGSLPDSIAVNPVTNIAYVTISYDETVSVIHNK